MSTNEPTPEKRIADELNIDPDMVPEHPPVHPEHLLNNPRPDVIYGEPPRTRLWLRGFNSDAITAEFLWDLHDLAEAHDLPLDATSVGVLEPDGRCRSR